MTETRFNIPLPLWDQAVEEIYGLLAGVARRRAITTYGELVTEIRTVRLPPDAHAFHWMLGDVSRRAFDEGGPLLSALVVLKDVGRPGGGFFTLARELGFEVLDERDAEDAFWAQQVERVHEWWRTR